MTRYEGLFILNLAGVEEGIKETIDRISKVMTDAGAKIDNIQKMDKRAFSRIADKKHTSGFYVNFIFDAPVAAVEQIQNGFLRDDEVFRLMITKGQAATAVAA